jgi:curved DNA-binding protein CbpA
MSRSPFSGSPVSASPYEVLGVSPAVNTEELRRAYRKALRETHPDTGGDPRKFLATQSAWELVGTPTARALYDRGRGGSNGSGSGAGGSGNTNGPTTFASQPERKVREDRPQARSSGHPGGWYREQYLAHMREWVGRGAKLGDPYDAALVRSAPRDIRYLLASAIAEEDTARTLATLGIAFTLWHDVATGTADGADAGKIDHIVLGPTGLFALLSEDWGGPVKVRRGEVIGETLAPGEQPVNTLSLRARWLARTAKVKFSTLIVVAPDDATPAPMIELGKIRGVPAVLVQHSALPNFLRTGLPNASAVGGNELFDVRTRLQSSVRFV